MLNSDINSLSVRSKLFGSYLPLVGIFCLLLSEEAYLGLRQEINFMEE